MSGCELEQEGFCTYESQEYGVTIQPHSCRHEGSNGECLATLKDLVDVCPYCLKPGCHNEDCLVQQSPEPNKSVTKND